MNPVVQAAARVRNLHLLRDPDGSCRAVYDLERTLVLDVPPQLRACFSTQRAALEANPELRDWLRSEDLLTVDAPVVQARTPARALPAVTDVSLDLSGACNMSCGYCFEHDIHSRTGPMHERTALASLDFAFENAAKSGRLTLHFGSGEPLLQFDMLQRIVAEAERRAARTGVQLGWEITTNATLVTNEIASFLTEHAFNVRVSCDGPPAIHDEFRAMKSGEPSYDQVVAGLRRLLDHLPDRLTVNSVLTRRTRLATLWRWATELGVRHYHVIKVGAYADRDLNLQLEELRNFESDLAAICAEMRATLRSGAVPIDYQPITKVVRRLMIPQPITRFCGVAGSYLGVAASGDVYPCFRHLGLRDCHLGDVWVGTRDSSTLR